MSFTTSENRNHFHLHLLFPGFSLFSGSTLQKCHRAQTKENNLFIFPLQLNLWYLIYIFSFKCLCVTLSMQYKKIKKSIFFHELRDSECQQLMLIFLVQISRFWAPCHRSQQYEVKSGPAYLWGLESTFVWLWRETNVPLWQIDARICISCRYLLSQQNRRNLKIH